MDQVEIKYFVFITTNPSKEVLNIGTTNNLAKKLSDLYKNRGGRKTFASRFSCYNLLYFEEFRFVNDAFNREEELKALKKEDKRIFVNEKNPDWKFLNEQIQQESETDY